MQTINTESNHYIFTHNPTHTYGYMKEDWHAYVKFKTHTQDKMIMMTMTTTTMTTMMTMTTTTTMMMMMKIKHEHSLGNGMNCHKNNDTKFGIQCKGKLQ
jgi:hypothetical protein